MSNFKDGHQLLMRSLNEQNITDQRVLRAMNKVLRHHFIPQPFRKHAYTLAPLPIGHGQTISSPFIVAAMSELLNLTGSERVLEIGTGCGYQTAVLCELASEVYSIEIVEPIAKLGQSNLKALGYQAELKIGDGSVGWASAAPFDAALIAATAPRIPDQIVAQIKIGGVLILPVEQGLNETLMRCTKTVHGLDIEELYDVRFVPMTGKIRSAQHEQK